MQALRKWIAALEQAGRERRSRAIKEFWTDPSGFASVGVHVAHSAPQKRTSTAITPNAPRISMATSHP